MTSWFLGQSSLQHVRTIANLASDTRGTERGGRYRHAVLCESVEVGCMRESEGGCTAEIVLEGGLSYQAAGTVSSLQ